jgi:hypothetical protein
LERSTIPDGVLEVSAILEGMTHILVVQALGVTEPPKSLGPPTVVLVQRTSDNPVGAPESLDKFGICFSYLSQERFTRHARRHYKSSEIQVCGSDYINLPLF